MKAVAGAGTPRIKSQQRSSSSGRRIPLSASWILIVGLVGLVLLLSVLLSASLVSRLHSDSSISLPSSSSNPLHRLRGSSWTNSKLVAPESEESVEQLAQRLPPSIWTTAGRNSDPSVATAVQAKLSIEEKEKAHELCGKLLYSTLRRAVQIDELGTFVSTGDIDDMWTRDSAVQMGLYVGRLAGQPWLRLVVEGAIRRQAFNIVQDPYANAYSRTWTIVKDLRDRVIGRGGWVATRNYELDSGAYFLTQLYDYYVVAAGAGLYAPHVLLEQPLIFEAVLLMINTWIIEQHHEEQSPYRYFELSRQGKGEPVVYTGMTWSGFRPSDDACQYGYLIPANIHAAAALERILELNKRIWRSDVLDQKASKLLRDIETGIRTHGVVKSRATGQMVYAYEVDGHAGILEGFDDANVPSLLSIPLLGWTGYDRTIYQATRQLLLSPKTNPYYFAGQAFAGIGSPHTPAHYVWPMAFAIQALTESATATSTEQVANSMSRQIQQSLKAACGDAMHEGVDSRTGCANLKPSSGVGGGGGYRKLGYTREWFEWANALFVVLVETATGETCDASAMAWTQQEAAKEATVAKQPARKFYKNQYKNDPKLPEFYQGVQAQVAYQSSNHAVPL